VSGNQAGFGPLVIVS